MLNSRQRLAAKRCFPPSRLRRRAPREHCESTQGRAGRERRERTPGTAARERRCANPTSRLARWQVLDLQYAHTCTHERPPLSTQKLPARVLDRVPHRTFPFPCRSQRRHQHFFYRQLSGMENLQRCPSRLCARAPHFLLGFCRSTSRSRILPSRMTKSPSSSRCGPPHRRWWRGRPLAQRVLSS
jgi:hypothetical protein